MSCPHINNLTCWRILKFVLDFISFKSGQLPEWQRGLRSQLWSVGCWFKSPDSFIKMCVNTEVLTPASTLVCPLVLITMKLFFIVSFICVISSFYVILSRSAGGCSPEWNQTHKKLKKTKELLNINRKIKMLTWQQNFQNLWRKTTRQGSDQNCGI